MNCQRQHHPSNSKTLKKHYDLFIIFPDSWTNLQTLQTRSIMVLWQSDTFIGLVTLLVILGVRSILLYTAAFWRCCVGSVNHNPVTHCAAGDQKIYQTPQYKRHYEGLIFFPGFQNIIQTFQTFLLINLTFSAILCRVLELTNGRFGGIICQGL